MIGGHDSGGALDALFWRSEILQAMFWMQGEGLAREVTAEDLARFLNADPEILTAQMSQLDSDGYLTAEPGSGYQLTDLGRSEGGRSFADEFRGLTQQAHGECSDSCWCNDPSHAGEECPTHVESPEHVH